MDNNIGNFICYLRKKKNISQEELASALNVSVTAVSKWERGVCNPRNSKMKDIALILGVSVKELENGKIKEKKEKNYSYLIILGLVIFCIFLLVLLVYNKEYYYKIDSLNSEYIGSGFIYANKDYEELYIHSLLVNDTNIKGYAFSYEVLIDDVTLLKDGDITNISINKKSSLIDINEYLASIQIYYKNNFLSYLNEKKRKLKNSELKVNIVYLDEKKETKIYQIKLGIFAK